MIELIVYSPTVNLSLFNLKIDIIFLQYLCFFYLLLHKCYINTQDYLNKPHI